MAREREDLLARIRELETGKGEMRSVLNVAREELWRLREALVGDDEEAQMTVAREVISKVEIRFTHETTGGHRSPTGKGKKVNKASGIVIYVRPRLGISCLFIPDWRSPAPADAPARASSSPPASRCPD